MQASIILITFVALVTSSVGTTYDDTRTSFRSNFNGHQAITAAVERRLQTNTTSSQAKKCLWTSWADCELNADFVTTLPGSPTTESQKCVSAWRRKGL